jgi:hypothetical protein
MKRQTAKKSKGSGNKLLSALTQEQIGSLLDAVGSRTLLEKIEENRKNSDPDMIKTVKAALQPDKKTKAAKRKNSRVASGKRLVEDWRVLWEQWDDIIGEVGDEEGKYSVQDHHWEEPYFDGSAVALDLEKVASEMLKQIDSVYDLIDDPDLFTAAIDDIDDAIESYPEWMGADSGDGCELEDQTTQCVLKWLWLSCKDEKNPGALLLKKLEEIEGRNDSVSLDRETTIHFVTHLPEPICREIHGELQNGRFGEAQEKAYSQWNAIAHEFEGRYDKNLYLKRCGRDLEKNWHNGAPLIRKAIQEKDWESAESWLVKTFAAYRHWHATSTWYPEKGLLIAAHQVWEDRAETAQAASLLELWSKVSGNLGNPERGIASRFQAAVLRGPEQLEKIVNEFKELRNEAPQKSLDMLFKQWQDEMALRSLPMYDDNDRFLDTWIHWAIVARTENDGADRFRTKCDVWLDSILQSKSEFRKQWKLLACLTDDLADSPERRKRFPGLFKTAIERFGGKSPLDKSRSLMVNSLCPSGTIEIVMEVWKKQFAHIIPDPAGSSNDYLKPVAWVKALKELNPDDYSRVIKRWRTVHHRRRNLWKAMLDAGLPVAS